MGKVKDFKNYLKSIGKNPKINSGRTFTIQGVDASKLVSSIVNFMGSEGIKFEDGTLPIITFTRKKSGTIPPFLETGNYNPTSNEITIFVNGRGLKDCLRSLAHELIHADQKINKGWEIEKASEGIYGKSKEVEKIEADAYLRGNLLFRKWEESIKGGF
jgi:hypothetical protein